MHALLRRLSALARDLLLGHVGAVAGSWIAAFVTAAIGLLEGLPLAVAIAAGAIVGMCVIMMIYGCSRIFDRIRDSDRLTIDGPHVALGAEPHAPGTPVLFVEFGIRNNFPSDLEYHIGMLDLSVRRRNRTGKRFITERHLHSRRYAIGARAHHTFTPTPLDFSDLMDGTEIDGDAALTVSYRRGGTTIETHRKARFEGHNLAGCWEFHVTLA